MKDHQGSEDAPTKPGRCTCRLVDLQAPTSDIRILRLEAEAGARFRFAAGQYAAVGFGDLPPRDFSIASRPDEPALEFHVRCLGDEGASGYVAQHLALGERVSVEGPYGQAWLREDHAGPILAIAGGSGLAPMKSIVETALASSGSREVHLYFGVRDEADVYLEDHFRALEARHAGFRFVPVLSDPSAPTARRCGLVGEAVAADFQDFAGFKAYLAGPPVMVEAASAMLLDRGLPQADLHADPFTRGPAKSTMAPPD